MYLRVVLIEDKTNLCIPASWVFCINLVNAYKSGVNRNEKKRIFFSKDWKCTPNFLLPLRTRFDPDENACYLAKIKNPFATVNEALEYTKKLRGGLPAVYNTMRIEMPPPFLNGEAQVAEEAVRQNNVKIEIKAEVDNQLALLRRAVSKLNRLLPPIDLTIDSDDEEDGVDDAILIDDEMPFEFSHMVN